MNYETFYGEKLFPKDKTEDLKNFKYKCECESITYKYIHSPIAEFTVEHIIPPTVAPNTLTILGFFINVVIIHIVFLKLYGMEMKV